MQDADKQQVAGTAVGVPDSYLVLVAEAVGGARIRMPRTDGCLVTVFSNVSADGSSVPLFTDEGGSLNSSLVSAAGTTDLGAHFRPTSSLAESVAVGGTAPTFEALGEPSFLGSRFLALIGKQSQINAALHEAVLVPDSGVAGMLSLNLTLADFGSSLPSADAGLGQLQEALAFELGSGFVARRAVPVQVQARNEAPVLVVPPGPLVVLEDADYRIAGTQVNDEAGGNVTVRLAARFGTLSLPTLVPGLDLSAGDCQRVRACAIRGPLVDVNQAIEEIVFRPSQNFNSESSTGAA